MIALALGLGIAGSLHCLGMCGPLVIGTLHTSQNRPIERLIYVLTYHLGRILIYGILGVLFASFGALIVIGSFQKVFTIVSGMVLILLFFLSMDLEKLLFRWPSYKSLYGSVQQFIFGKMGRLSQSHPFVLGMCNGLLPCGLVYLALTGSMTTGTSSVGGLFMIAFGIGTLPMMLSVHMGVNLLPRRRLVSFQRLFPILHLVMGLFLIYRGWVVDMPMDIDFMAAIKHPIMCH